MYNNVESFEEAKKVMQDISPKLTEKLKKANIESIFVLGVCGMGAGGLALSLTGVPTAGVLLPVTLGPALAASIRAACRILKDNKKNKDILDGKYFEGKSEEEIVREANQDYVRVANNLEQI